MPVGRSRRRSMLVGAAVASSRSKNRPAVSQTAGPAAASAPVAPSAADTQVAEIQKFFELQKQGIITEEEFSAKKRQILGL